jgi:hypothetical protein
LSIGYSDPSGSQLHFQVTTSPLTGPNNATSVSIPLSVSQPNGSINAGAPLTVTITANTTGLNLAAGSYTGSLTVTDTNHQAASQTEPVTLTVATADTGITGTYTGTYQGTAIPASGPLAQVSGTLTLTISSATPVTPSGFAGIGNIAATNFFGQTVGPVDGSGLFDPQNNRFDFSSALGNTGISLDGPGSNEYGTISGSPGHYVLTVTVHMSDARGDLSNALSATLTQQ